MTIQMLIFVLLILIWFFCSTDTQSCLLWFKVQNHWHWLQFQHLLEYKSGCSYAAGHTDPTNKFLRKQNLTIYLLFLSWPEGLDTGFPVLASLSELSNKLYSISNSILPGMFRLRCILGYRMKCRASTKTAVILENKYFVLNLVLICRWLL